MSRSHVIPRPAQYVILGVLVAVAAALVIAVIVREPAGSGEAAPARDTPTASATTSTTEAPAISSMYVVGDSFTGGSSMNEGPTWPNLVAAEEGWTVGTDGRSGSGYVAPGARDWPFTTRINNRLVESGADAVILAGGLNDAARINDGETTVAEVAAAATDTIEQLKVAMPSTRIVMLSPFASGAATSTVLELRDAFADVAANEGVAYIDVTDYLTPDLIGSDGVHPTDAGHAAIAEQITPALLALN